MALPLDGPWLIGVATGAELTRGKGAALPADDPWLNAVTNLVLLASAATWIYLVAKWLSEGRLVEYLPRRPVPWGPVATVMALALAVLTIAVGATLGEAEHQAVADPADAAWQLAASILPIIVLTGGFAIAIALASRALPADLGFPASAGDLARDVRLGIVTCLAAAPPVFGAVALLQYVLDLEGESHHPLVELIGETDSGGVFLLATVMTVLVAPVCEEITFRLLLQGWLEKWDLAAWDHRQPPSSADSQAPPSDPPPVGWTPILLSAVIFAAAHFGYGPEPVPIFILAIVLGYVYRQTHRIIPCIVAHAMFNSFSMLILWRTMLLQAAGQ
jgi:membrane protease YdiL (CAAX protease family)